MDSAFLDFLIEPFSHGFMQRAVLVSCLIGLVCALFSCFLVLKGWSLMGDAVAHAVLPGLGLAYLLSIPLAIGAFVAGFFSVLSIGYLKNHSRIKEDAIMGIVFSGMFALGLVMLGHIQSDIDLFHVLFGNVLGMSTNDVMETGIIAVLCSLILFIKRKDFMLYCFDPAYARASGLPSKILHYSLLVLLALTIVSALKAAGIILVIAMLIAPGAIGFLWSKSFDRMMLVAVVVSLASSLAGTILSYHFDTATAPTIVVLQACLFLCVLFGRFKLKPQ